MSYHSGKDFTEKQNEQMGHFLLFVISVISTVALMLGGGIYGLMEILLKFPLNKYQEYEVGIGIGIIALGFLCTLTLMIVWYFADEEKYIITAACTFFVLISFWIFFISSSIGLSLLGLSIILVALVIVIRPQ